MAQLKPAGKFVLLLLIGGLLTGGYFTLTKSGILGKAAGAAMQKNGDTAIFSGKNDDCVKVGINQWIGFAGGVSYNGGFAPSDKSRFTTEQGICVDFKVFDFVQAIEAWKVGAVDLVVSTVDTYPIITGSLADQNPVLVMQIDWSRGGDAIVTRRGINSAGDLKGKKVAVAEGTPSHTFLLWLLKANNLSQGDITTVKVADGIEAAKLFKAEQVDAAVVWSPDDEDCVANVQGSKVLISTKQASAIIADGFVAKKEWANANKAKLTKFIQGWLKANAELNASADKRKEAAKIMATSFEGAGDFFDLTMDKARFSTFGDNKIFFGLMQASAGVTAKEVYNQWSREYTTVGMVSGKVPDWSVVNYTDALASVNLPDDAELTAPEFTKATVEEQKAPAVATKSVSINFPLASSTLTDDAKYVLDRDALAMLKGAANMRVRVEGNTDIQGNAGKNVVLSRDRAKSVIRYLVNQHGFDPDRFVEVGNGSNNPICSDDSEACYARNRRTDIVLIAGN